MDKNWPSRLLGALPQRKWVKPLQDLGQEVLAPLWQHVADKSPVTRRRWQWTWGADDRVFKKYGEPLGLVGRWWSGKAPEVVVRDGEPVAVILGIDEYWELLERLEDAEDLKMLEEMRRKPLRFRRLEDFLKEVSYGQRMKNAPGEPAR